MGLPFIELDAINWLPGWIERDEAEFRDLLATAMREASDGWVVDGNYGRLRDQVLEQADTVVWLNLPWRVMLWRVLKRTFRRAWDKQQICGENTESWRQVLSTKSLWWWYIADRKQLITRVERMLPLVPAGVPVINIKSAWELNRFYEVQGLVRD